MPFIEKSGSKQYAQVTKKKKTAHMRETKRRIGILHDVGIEVHSSNNPLTSLSFL